MYDERRGDRLQGSPGARREQVAHTSALPDAHGPGAASATEAALLGLLSAGGGGRIETFTATEPHVYLEYAAFGLSHYQAKDPDDWPAQKLAELLPHTGALGDYLEHLPPGVRLATLLAAIDHDRVDDFSLVEVVAAHKRMEAWSAAQAARAAAALAEREALNPTWPGTLPGRTRGECVVGEELAMRLRVSRLTATRLAACGRAFTGMFEATGKALELGLIDFPRAQAIFSALDGLPAEVAIAAQWEVLEKAPGRTLRQLQQDLAKAIIAVDPDDADARHRTARQKRRVNRPRPLPDGMALFSAVMPAVDAIALDTAIDAAARAAKHNGSGRTLDQLRADALALMGHTALVLGHIGPHAGDHCRCGCAPRSAADGDTPAAPSANDGRADTPPSAVDDDGPTSASAADEDAPMPASTGDEDAPASAAGGAPTSASTSHSDPPTPTRGPGAAVADAPPRPGERLSGGCLPTIRLGTLGGGRADIRITVPLSVMLPATGSPPGNALERDPEPVAELEGYGPIPPEVARALAAGGVWRRLVTDPTGTEVLNVGRTRYQPTAAIADLVRERDRTCIRPACSTPARSCDLDHRHEWQDGGETSVWNVNAMCGGDHPLKSIGAFTVARASDGTYAWTTPTGHGYLRRVDGTVLPLPRRAAEGLRAAGREFTRSGRSLEPETVDAALAAVAAGDDGGESWAAVTVAAGPHPARGLRPASWGVEEPPF